MFIALIGHAAEFVKVEYLLIFTWSRLLKNNRHPKLYSHKDSNDCVHPPEKSEKNQGKQDIQKALDTARIHPIFFRFSRH